MTPTHQSTDRSDCSRATEEHIVPDGPLSENKKNSCSGGQTKHTITPRKVLQEKVEQSSQVLWKMFV